MTSTDKVRVAVADDEVTVRAGLRMLIDGESDLEVVAEAGDGEAAVRAARECAPDVLLLDVRMPSMNGLEAAREIRRLALPVRVLVLTTLDEEGVVDEAVRQGVAGFLLKASPPEEMLQAIRRAHRGQGSLDPSVVPGLLARFARGPVTPRDPRLNLLTPRELDVLTLVGKGYSNTEVAASLYLGEATVKTHLSHALDKLELRDRARAIAFAHESGLLSDRKSGES